MQCIIMKYESCYRITSEKDIELDYVNFYLTLIQTKFHVSCLLEIFTFSPLQKDETWFQKQRKNNVINRQKPKCTSNYIFYLFSLIWRESFGCQEWAHSLPLKTEIFFLFTGSFQQTNILTSVEHTSLQNSLL